MRVKSVPLAPASPGPTADEKASRNERLMDPVPFIPACLLACGAAQARRRDGPRRDLLRDLRGLRVRSSRNGQKRRDLLRELRGLRVESFS
jgi:hypothetical protein